MLINLVEHFKVYATCSLAATAPPSITPTTTGAPSAAPAPIGAIVGGVVGGICLVLVILIDIAQFLIWLNKRSHSKCNYS